MQGDELIWLDNALQMPIDLMKGSGFPLKKTKSRQYPDQTITDTGYADNLVLLLHSLEQAAGDIGLYMNVSKTVHMF